MNRSAKCVHDLPVSCIPCFSKEIDTEKWSLDIGI